MSDELVKVTVKLTREQMSFVWLHIDGTIDAGQAGEEGLTPEETHTLCIVADAFLKASTKKK